MRSSRWHAAGNVYLLTDAPLDADAVRDAVGDADGILQVLAAHEDEVEIVIWNPDGSRAEMSGNGTRIAARWLADRTGASTVRVLVGPRTVVARVDGDRIEQQLGPVQVLGREEVDGFEVTLVDVGNPHAVVVGDPGQLPEIGPRLETHERFPDRTNVQVVRVEAPGLVTARVWERGVGETQSSGSSAVAVAAATTGDGRTIVRFPGGDLEVEIADGEATLTGPVERVAG
jgi:diaminopimelate epimerase